MNAFDEELSELSIIVWYAKDLLKGSLRVAFFPLRCNNVFGSKYEKRKWRSNIDFSKENDNKT